MKTLLLLAIPFCIAVGYLVMVGIGLFWARGQLVIDGIMMWMTKTVLKQVTSTKPKKKLKWEPYETGLLELRTVRRRGRISFGFGISRQMNHYLCFMGKIGYLNPNSPIKKKPRNGGMNSALPLYFLTNNTMVDFLFGFVIGGLVITFLFTYLARDFKDTGQICESQGYTYEKGFCFDGNTKLELSFN